MMVSASPSAPACLRPCMTDLDGWIVYFILKEIHLLDCSAAFYQQFAPYSPVA